MPGQLLPPESFGPCAIAGERLTAASNTRAMPESNRVFISVLRDFEREFEPADPAAMIRRTAASSLDGGRQVDRRRA
jgi:hypothetical protein